MPNVHFVGNIEFSVVSINEVSITYAIVPGNNAWYLKRGVSSGETHACITSATTGKAIFSHPIDCQFDSSSTEGWPFFVCEVWERGENGMRGFHGCGCAWIPMVAGKHVLDLHIWRPINSGLEKLNEMFLPTIPDLRELRELIVSPYLRSEIQVENMGNVQVQVTTVISGFEAYGVTFA